MITNPEVNLRLIARKGPEGASPSVVQCKHLALRERYLHWTALAIGRQSPYYNTYNFIISPDTKRQPPKTCSGRYDHMGALGILLVMPIVHSK